MSLVLAVLLAHAAHEGPRLTRLLQADKLDGVDLVLRAQRLFVGLVGQRHPPVFGQRARGVRELRALGAQVGGAHRAVHGGRVALVLVTADDALAGKGKSKGGGCRTRAGLVNKRVIPAKGGGSYFSHALQGFLRYPGLVGGAVLEALQKLEQSKVLLQAPNSRIS